MTALAILERRAQARRTNIAKSRFALTQLGKQKDKQQYDSYLSNVNTLNSMKKILADLYPALDAPWSHPTDNGDNASAQEEGQNTHPPASQGGKKSGHQADTLRKKRQLVNCIVSYERDIKNYEAAWREHGRASDAERSSRRRAPGTGALPSPAAGSPQRA